MQSERCFGTAGLRVDYFHFGHFEYGQQEMGVEVGMLRVDFLADRLQQRNTLLLKQPRAENDEMARRGRPEQLTLSLSRSDAGAIP